MKKKYVLKTEMHGDLIEVRITNRGKLIYKKTCPINNQEKILELGNILKYKFDINFETKRKKFVDGDVNWFE